MLAHVRVFVHRFLRVIVRLCACSRVRLHVRAPFGCEQFSHAKLVVGVKGFEPLRLTAADFKSAASAVPPHPHMRVFAILRSMFALAVFARVMLCSRCSRTCFAAFARARFLVREKRVCLRLARCKNCAPHITKRLAEPKESFYKMFNLAQKSVKLA